MTLKDAALVAGVTPDTLRQAANRGTLRAVKVGRQWLVTYRELDRYRHEQGRKSRRAA